MDEEIVIPPLPKWQLDDDTLINDRRVIDFLGSVIGIPFYLIKDDEYLRFVHPERISVILQIPNSDYYVLNYSDEAISIRFDGKDPKREGDKICCMIFLRRVE